MMKASSAPSSKRVLEVATQASLSAGKVLLRHFRKKLQIREKKDAGLVSNADLAAEQAAMKVLREGFPDFGFLTEESGKRESTSPGRWIIDPLDGTTNFVHGIPVFCVSIAAEWAGKVIVGVVHQPLLNETFTAVAGRGAYLNGKRMRVSSHRKIRNSLLTTGFSYRKEELLQKEMITFEQFSRVTRAIRRPGSAALDLAYTACGFFDGFWERGLSPWDVAAGTLLVQEAGGKVTDFKGDVPRLDAGQIVASNGKIHREILHLLKNAI